jgi:hypothetical protein
VGAADEPVSSYPKELEQRIRVCVRKRPMNKKEMQRQERDIITQVRHDARHYHRVYHSSHGASLSLSADIQLTLLNNSYDRMNLRARSVEMGT